MNTLESQVAKIQIGNFKQTASYVSTFAEKAAVPDCELYAVVELPLFNPAAIPDCERISQALIATLKRAYRRGNTESTFEVALGEINEELGKLATLGQTNWVGKLNGAVAVKSGSVFNIATTGRVTALLFREGELSDITDSPKARHPLKTFENFATGKLKPEDILVLSTAELFNHVSVDRLTNIIGSKDIGTAAQQIVEILEDNAGPEVAFGTLLLYQSIPQAPAPDEVINLEEFLPPERSIKGAVGKAGKKIGQLLTHHTLKTTGQKFGNLAKSLVNKKPNISITSMAEKTRQNIQNIGKNSRAFGSSNLQKFNGLPRSKKFFAISALVLALAVVVNIFLAKNFKSTKEENATATVVFTELQRLLSEADGNLLYENEDGARNALSMFNAEAAKLKDLSNEQQQEFGALQNQARELERKLNKITTLNITDLGSLSASDHLIVLPGSLATASGNSIISFNKETNTITDGSLKSSATIVTSVYTKGNNAVIYDGQGLSVWNFSSGNASSPLYLNVPKSANLVGLSYYDTNSRAYLIDTEKQQIITFAVSDKGVSQPATWIKPTAELGDSIDMAIDGNVYVLRKNGVSKYTKGVAQAFNFPSLSTPLSGNGKIFTNKDAQYIYILDSGNKRVVVINKQGALVEILESDQLSSPSDFTVDEANRTLYILNNGNLLKATY